MNLSEKYKPLYLNELETNYDLIKEYLDQDKTFIINGSKNSGKSTILKLYLSTLNYDYLLIDNFNSSKECILEKIKYKTKSVYSYFLKKKFIIIIDNFDLFDNSIKEYIINNSNIITYVIITNKYLTSKINYIRINNYSIDYLMNLYCTIYFLEKGINCKYIPTIYNITHLFTLLEFDINSNNSDIDDLNNYKLIYDKYDYNFNDLIKEKNFNKKITILNNISSYNIFHSNLIYNYSNIDDLAYYYDTLSTSLELYSQNYNETNEYYTILSMIGISYELNNYKIIKNNFQFKKKNFLKYY
tara:strand:- start:2205 stop:3104 length:900 start_codon:yes stop_codon:yes gene_type:complete